MTNSNSDHPAVAPTVEALKEVRGYLQQNDVRAAQRRLEEARDALMAHDANDQKVRELKSAVFAELGLLHQRLHNPDDAFAAFDEAASLARGLAGETSEKKHSLQLATTLINASGLHARTKTPDKGLEMANEALGMLRKLEDDGTPTRQVLLLGGLQNQASLLLAMKNPAAAEATLVEAQQIVNGLLTSMPQMIAQAIELNSRLSMVQRMQGRGDEAVLSAQGAARLAEAAYQGGAKQGLVWYVNSQLQLVDTYASLGQFSSAEDHLWKAIDAANSPQPMMIGSNFYCAMLRRTDEQLDAGGLPRDEVTEALDELIGRMEGLKAPEDILGMIRARYELLVDGDVAKAEGHLKEIDDTGREISPGAGEIRKLLESDIAWKKTQE